MNIKRWCMNGILVCLMLIVTQAVAWKAPDVDKTQKTLTSDLQKRGFKGMKAFRLDDLKDEQSKNPSWNKIQGSGAFAHDSLQIRLNKRLAKIGAEVKVTQIQEDKVGNRHIRFLEYYKEIPVIGSDFVVHVNKNNEIYSVNGNFVPLVNIQATASISAEKAIAFAKTAITGDSVFVKGTAHLVVFDSTLAYEVTIVALKPQMQIWKMYVDANTGSILGKMDQLFRAAPGTIGSHVPVSGNRLTKEDGASVSVTGWHDTLGNYFLYNKNTKWGVYNLSTGDWDQRSTPSWGTSDRAAVSLAKNFEITQNFVTTKLGRNSFNNAGAFAQGNVHEGSNYVNAYWDGSDFHFGDGDNSQAGPLTTLDISAHEYGHAITQYTSNLVYSYESGALNESFSDIMGTVVEFYSQPDGRSAYPHSTPGYADWLCGEDAWMAGDALRDLRDPLRYSNPSYYMGTYWYTGSGDNGGVHYNSGVQNKAFYLLAEGGSGSNDGHPYNLTGMGVDTAGQIALYANMFLLTSSSQYRDSRNAWIQAAVSLGFDANRVGDTWAAVGVMPLVKHLAATPLTVNFDSVGVGVHDTMIITLSNNGADATLVSALSFSNASFTTATSAPFTVAGGATLPLRIVFSPTEFGLSTGNLSITSNAADNPLLTVAMSGSGVNPAAIVITPRSLYRTVPVGDSTIATMTITNSGEAALNFTIAERDNAAFTPLAEPSLYDENNFLPLVKGAPDTRIGHPQTSFKGGPDRAGYAWKDSDEPGGPAYQWNDIKSTGTMLGSISSCDDCFQSQSLSFKFPFYGNMFDTMYVSSNGFITFGMGTSQIGNYPLPSPSAPANLIDALHDDLYPSAGGDIYFKDFGDKAIIQFDNVYPYSGSGVYTFQIVLERSGNIYFYYNNLTGPLTGCTVGIQNATRDDGLTVAYNTPYLKNTQAIKFSPKSKWLRVSPESGTISAGQTANVSVTFDGKAVSGGTYYGNLDISHNAPGSINPLAVPCTLYVDGIRRLNSSTSSILFKSKWVGARDTASITLTNNGDEATLVNSITSSNSVFTCLMSTPVTVLPFTSTTVRMVFLPDSVKIENGTLTITSNAEDNPVITCNLQGTGTTPPRANITPKQLTFSLQPSDDPANQTCTITNTGGDTLGYAVASVQDAAMASLQKEVTVIPAIRTDLIYSSKNYENPFIEDHVIVAFKEGFKSFATAGLLNSIGGINMTPLAVAKSPVTKTFAYTGRNLFLIKLSASSKNDVLNAIKSLQQDANVAYAEPDYIVTAYRTPNDTYFSNLYGMQNNGQTGGMVHADIDATAAWDRHTGNKSIIIGIIDTGIDYLHPDLVANIWTNPGEIPGNGIDDDGNGFIDDIHGYDFVNNDGNPMDDHYHGTHCAGTIGGVGNNGMGVAGVMWNTSLMGIKFLDASGSGSTAGAISAVNYAAAMGVQITSNSWGGGAFSQSLMDMIASGKLFVAAAGNNGTNNDVTPSYPATYSLDNIISVAATDHNDLMASFSCYGPTTVDLGAPGVNIYSCQPNNLYQYLSGTSMATPHVSGAAGLVWSLRPSATALDIKRILLSSVDPISSLSGRVLTNGRLNVNKALQATGPAWLSVSPNVPGKIPAGQSAPLVVTVNPTRLIAGTLSGNIVVSTTDPLLPADTIHVTATIGSCKSLAISVDTINYGNVRTGLTKSVSVTLTNTCNDTVTISSITSTNPLFSVPGTAPLRVMPFSTLLVSLSFTPVIAGQESASILITSDASDHPVNTVFVYGRGLLSPQISFSHSSFSQTLLTGDSATQTLTIKNSVAPGNENLIFSIATNDTRLNQDFPALIPVAPNSNSTGGISLSGTHPPLTKLFPAPLSKKNFNASGLRILFATTTILTDATDNFVTGLHSLSNVDSVKVLSCVSSTPNLAYLQGYDIVVVASSSYWADPVLMGNVLADFVDAGGKVCIMNASFCSGGSWTMGGRIIQPAYSPFSVSSYTNGSTTSQVFENHPITQGVNSITSGLYSNNSTLQGNGKSLGKYAGGYHIAAYNPDKPIIVFNVFPVDGFFGGDLALMMGNAFDYLADASSWLKLSSKADTLVPGDSAVITLTFNTREMLGGSYFKTLSITHDATGTVSPYSVPCTLIVDGVKRLTSSATSIPFRSTWVGLRDTSVITLSNSGNEATLINSISSSNPVFSCLSTSPFTVLPFGSIAVKVVFSPDSAQGETGTLTINSNAEDNPLLTIAMAGTGTMPPQILISPNRFDISANSGDTLSRQMTIANFGGAALSYSIKVNAYDSASIRLNREMFNQMRGLWQVASLSHKIPIVNNGQTNSNDTLFHSAQDTVISTRLPNLGNGKNVLIFRDNLAWGYNVNQPLLASLGATVSIARSADMDTINLASYDLIVFESQQSYAFYSSYVAHISKFENYLTQGGKIQFHCATYTSYRLPSLPFPGGMTTYQNYQLENTNFAKDRTHPVLAGADSILIGTYASHEGLTNLPSSAKVLVVNTLGNPTTVEYRVGRGILLVTAMTWEYGYNNNSNSAIPLLSNAFAYMLSVQGKPDWLSIDTNLGGVNPGDSSKINLHVNASNLIAGTYTGALSVSHNATQSASPVIVPVHLTVTGISKLSVSPLSVNFGTTRIGTNRSISIMLTNTGSQSTIVNALNFSDSHFTCRSPLPFSVPAFDSVSMILDFYPTQTGVTAGALVISSNASDNPSINLPLTGTGIMSAVLIVRPESIRTNVRTRSITSVNVTLQNPGMDSLHYSIASLSNGNWLSTTTSSGIIAPHSERSITATINASNFGQDTTLTGSLQISHDASNAPTPLTVPVTVLVRSTLPPKSFLNSVESSSAAALYGHRYQMRSISIGKPMVGKMNGSKYKLILGK